MHDKLDFDMFRGEIVGLVGPRTGGRLALLETLLGLRPLSGGSVTLPNAADQIGLAIGCEDGTGYALFEHFEGQHDLRTSETLIAQHTRNYAKRQLTFFRNRLEVEWVQAPKNNADLAKREKDAQALRERKVHHYPTVSDLPQPRSPAAGQPACRARR